MSTITQDELEFAELRSTDWLFVKKLLQDLQADFARKERYLIHLVSRYLIGLELFRLCEELTIHAVKNPSTRDRNCHRGMMVMFRGMGLLLLEDLRLHEDVDIKKCLGFGYEDLAAYVDELEMDERMHYSDMTAERRAQIEQEIFGREQGTHR